MPTSMLGLWNSTTRSHWHDPAWRNRYYYNMSHFPGIGDLIRFQESMDYWNDYFKNRPGSGGWANVKYPALMQYSGNASRGVTSGYQYVSRNLYSLYDERGYRPNPKYRDVMFG